MKTINRTVLTIKGKEPYIDWANSFDDEVPKMSKNDQHTTAYLIPDTYDPESRQKRTLYSYSQVLQEQLVSGH